MSTQAPIPSPPPTASPALSYLHDMQALQGELQTAMLAISGNRLSVLEESLWRQQVLCTSLKHLSLSLVAEHVQSPLLARIRETSLALQQLNRSYALLIQQSSQSTDLLLRLCRSYNDAAPPPPATAPRSMAWTCEA